MVSLRSRCSRNLGTHMHKKWWCLARVTDFLSCISYFSCSSHVASLVRLTLVNNISQSSPINLGSFIYRWINNYNWSLIKNPKQHLSNRSDLSVGSVWLFVRINYEISADCQIFFYPCKHFNNNMKSTALILHDTLAQSLINSLLTPKFGYS